MKVTDVRDVPFGEWVATVQALREEGYAYFDWLTAVDQTDAAGEDPGSEAGFDDGSGLGLRPLLLPDGFEGTPLRKSFVLAARASKPWPGAKEPGEGHDSARAPGRRRVQAPGVPGPEWGPR